MAYNEKLAERIRGHLADFPKFKIEEKKMFRGLTFMVNEKMCIGVSNDNLMCRFDPLLQEEVAKKRGFQTMMMKGREYKGYCYISHEGYRTKKDLEYWIALCLEYNAKAKSSRK